MPKALQKSPKTTRTTSPKHNDHPLSRETDTVDVCSWCWERPRKILTREDIIAHSARTPEKKKVRNAKWPSDFHRSGPFGRTVFAFEEILRGIEKEHGIDANKVRKLLFKEAEGWDYDLACALMIVRGRKNAENEVKLAWKLLDVIRADHSSVDRHERECAALGIICRGETHLQHIDWLSAQYRIPKNGMIQRKVIPPIAAGLANYLTKVVKGKQWRDAHANIPPEQPYAYKTNALKLTKIIMNAFYGKGGVLPLLRRKLTPDNIKSAVQNHPAARHKKVFRPT